VALGQIKRGKKLSKDNWDFYMLPSFYIKPYRKGRISKMARIYLIHNAMEAVAFLNHKILGPRFLEFSREIYKQLKSNGCRKIFGSSKESCR